MQSNSYVPIQQSRSNAIQHSRSNTIQQSRPIAIKQSRSNTTVMVQCNTSVMVHCNTTVTSCELVSSIRYKLTCAYSEDSNQSVHPPSLIRLLVFRRCFGLFATHIVPLLDSDQAARMRRLISIFDGHTCQLEPFAGNAVILLDKKCSTFPDSELSQKRVHES